MYAPLEDGFKLSRMNILLLVNLCNHPGTDSIVLDEKYDVLTGFRLATTNLAQPGQAYHLTLHVSVLDIKSIS